MPICGSVKELQDLRDFFFRVRLEINDITFSNPFSEKNIKGKIENMSKEHYTYE